MTDPISLGQAEDFPAVPAAFGFVIKRYELSLTRFESAHSRLSTISTFVPTAYFGGVAFIASAADRALNLGSPWFIAAAGLVSLSMLVCWFARLRWADFRVFDLNQMYERTLHLDPGLFRLYWIKWAAEDSDDNASTNLRLYWAAFGSMVLFAAGILALAMWAVTQLRESPPPTWL